MEISKVKNENDCAEIACTDAYGPEEEAVGWLTCIEGAFESVKAAKVLGIETKITGFDLEGEAIVVALCKTGKYVARVSLSSVEWLKLTRVQKLWLSAWKKRVGV